MKFDIVYKDGKREQIIASNIKEALAIAKTKKKDFYYVEQKD